MIKFYIKTIIASHSLNHIRDLNENIDNKNSILIEKPIFADFQKYKSLKESAKKNIYLNLEFFNAYYLEDFKEKIDFNALKKVEMVWLDPFLEKKEGGTKYSEVFTSIFQDQLLHLISIFKKLGFDCNYLELTKLINDRSSRKLIIINSYKNIEVKFTFSRFSKERVRKIKINDDEMVLDFKGNPFIESNNKKIFFY